MEVIRKENDWLSDYRGKTWTDKLNYKLSIGLFEEHFKKMTVYVPQFEKAIVYCLDPKTKEILAVGGSSLLFGKKTGDVIPDLILDNFGLIYAKFFRAAVAGEIFAAVKDDGNITENIYTYTNGVNNQFMNGGASGTRIQMGSGVTAPARTNFGIQTALATAPESGYLNTNDGGYTISNTVIYQGDANPTGGSGTVNEAITSGRWLNGAAALKNITITRDAISPGVAFTAGKLLRAAYTWTL